MKIEFKQVGTIVFGSLLLSACSRHPNIQKVTEQEVNKYENKYLQEYEKIKQNYQDNEIIKWIQAANKKETCKVFVGTNLNNDRTKDPEYKIYWDGKCKNGYAYGLGREFERGNLTDLEAIAIYSGNQEIPKYYIQKDNLKNILIEGDLNNHYIVKTIINDNEFDFDIHYEYGFFSGSPKKPALIIYSSPFQDNLIYLKGYPNFAYKIIDFTKNEFDNRKYEFDIISNNNTNLNSFGFASYKNGYINAGEIINGVLKRNVQLPKSFFQKADKIFEEIKEAGLQAMQAQKKAWLVKEQYKKKICNHHTKVKFINNNKYKAICHEDAYYAKIKQKIDKKLAKINLIKTQKRQQIQEERLIRAREAEARAAQRRANAAEDANYQRALNNFNQTLQNINSNMIRQNTNFQLQQINNYLRYGY